jgi:hypothetical protein
MQRDLGSFIHHYITGTFKAVHKKHAELGGEMSSRIAGGRMEAAEA